MAPRDPEEAFSSLPIRDMYTHVEQIEREVPLDLLMFYGQLYPEAPSSVCEGGPASLHLYQGNVV